MTAGFGKADGKGWWPRNGTRQPFKLCDPGPIGSHPMPGSRPQTRLLGGTR